jgi:peptidoglycan/xylan/chitin deacetylase (PgdA/CDA1 family)
MNKGTGILRRLIWAAILVFLGVIPGVMFAEVAFSSLDLSASNELLFSATTDTPDWGTHEVLLYSDLSAVASSTGPVRAIAGGDVLDDVPMHQLTHFPEIMTYLPELRSVQIQNRFGLFRASVSDAQFASVEGFDSFVDGGVVPNGRIVPVTASPDGKYLVILEPTSPAYARMILQSTQSDDSVVVAERMEISLEEPPAKWSPDSQFFVYSKDGELYYYSIGQYERGRLLGESFRHLGEGTLASLQWSPDGSLYYVSGSLVYRIFGAEFFTRSLYAGLLQIGTIVGKIPFPFDPSFDTYWVAPDGNTAILNKGGSNLFVLFLNTDDFVDEGQILGLPSLFLPRNTRVRQVLWSDLNDVTILASGIQSGEERSTIFRLSIDPGAGDMVFTRMEDGGVREIALSPNQERIALMTETEIVFRSHATWTHQRTVPVSDPLHAVWIDNERMVIGGRWRIEVVSSTDGSSEFLSLSQTDSHTIADDGTIYATAAGGAYMFSDRWTEITESLVQEHRVASGELRVFLESLAAGSYRNVVMVRRTRAIGTSRLFEPPEQTYEEFEGIDEPVDLSYFTHGSRTRSREVSFVFNAVDSVEGLTEILNTLNGYDITATFFVNGEFIRRHPAALQEITDAGHEVGSLFFACFDMSDRRYLITEEFVREGLSRNEDDYFNATGNELSLVWHAPYYFVSDSVVDAGESANYIYVGRDVDSLDWVPRLTEEGLSQLYMPAADLVERVLDVKRPGSIISMQVGISDEARGGRDDYLFQKLDLLINGLLSQGYAVVPVSTLVQHAR